MKFRSALVLGGGFVGLSCALRLQKAGFAVLLAYPSEARLSPSLGNAGHLAVEQGEPLACWRMLRQAPSRHIAFGGPLDFPLRDFAQWAPFAARLTAAASPHGFRKGKAALEAWLGCAVEAWRRFASEIDASSLVAIDGHYVVWEKTGSAASGAAGWKARAASGASFRQVSEGELGELRARVSTTLAGAIRFEGSGQIIDLQAMHDAAMRAFLLAGGKRLNASAARLVVDGGRAAVILTDGTRLVADIVVAAAGVGTGPLLRGVGHRAPVIAERGYHIEGAAPEWPKGFPPVVFEDRAVIATRFADTLRLAGFLEFSHVDSPPDRRKWRRLRRHARELGLPLAEPIREWVGARPTLPDYRPAIGRSRRADNLLYAFGHQHLGLTLAPLTAETIAQLAVGETPALDISAFDLARFDSRASGETGA